MSDWLVGYRENYRAAAEQWLPSVVSRAPEITSADKAYAWMRDNDLYVPRAYVREQWGTIIRGAEKIDIINRLSDADLIPRAWMQDTSFEYGKRYNYIIKMTGTDIETGQIREEYMTVISDENLTIGEIQGQAVNAAASYGFVTWEPDFDVSFDTVKLRG